jgi:hypothetical protein
MIENYKPGFQGYDRMREKAEEAFRGELKSSSDKKYAGGGRVNGLTKDQTDLHIPKLKHYRENIRYAR